MRAVVHDRYGPPEVLRLEDVERPIPEDDQVLIKVHATTVNRTDSGLRSAEYFVSRFFTGLRRPKRKILGMELAGEVEAVGGAVTEFRVGDEVFGVGSYGAHAEYVCRREHGPLAHKPADMTFEEAAAVCDGASLALACMRKAGVREGQSIVVYGASGSVGTAAVQLGSKYFGADVTAVCNTKNLELVRSLGAGEVIDYTQEDFTKNGKSYDVVFDAVGKHSFRRCRHSLTPGGTFVSTDPGFMWHVPLLALLTRLGDKKVKMGVTRFTKDDVLLLKELIEAGKFRAVIDRTYLLEDVVEATRYVETGQKTGNVVLTVGRDGAAGQS
jgi:NADPH:quinone reductase-like Zn-dependent oxidoreductase